ncbi:MAG: DAK2 domain-containing protein [Clostridia bacterium]|nr:DAK2 domain-containing protein [Clostridia bacterium]MBR5985746.1 DAK2 domain-containing protein [Clostridia bacterium]
MSAKTIDGSLFREMLTAGCTYLNNNRESVDALNVFPVPDGDTGTNMCHTINAAVKEVGNTSLNSVSDVAQLAAKGALRGARGNSGVILSQILRGFAQALDGCDEMDAQMLARCFRSAAQTAYKAVMKPKEGTILTVARVMAEDCEKYLKNTSDVTELFALTLRSGEEILKHTPEMLPVLKQAGVVDSGGKGLMVIFNGFYAALTGNYTGLEEAETVSSAMPGDFVDDHEAIGEIKFAYCTEFIVSRPKEGMTNADVSRLRRRLERIGDCVIVVSDLSVVKVHVHTNEPGKALQWALELGELDNLKIDNMLEERREVERKKAEAAAQEFVKDYGIVAVALGDGFTEIFKSLEIDRIVDGGQTMNPSIEDLQKAIDETRAKVVYVLPNNTNIILAAQQAAGLTKRQVYVLPTKSVPMGIAAALAFSPSADPETNLNEMNEAAQKVHTASITFSVRDTVFDEMQIHANDIMGMIDNKIQQLGRDAKEVAIKLLESMVGPESGVITVYYGQDVEEQTAQALGDEIQDKYADCEVYVQSGGQPLYYYLIAVE